MKNFFLATAAAIALFAAPVMACETKAIAGSNATQKVDPNCQFATVGGSADLLFIGAFDNDADPSTPDVGAVKANLGGGISGVLVALN